jgi:predicted small metal-binding protein
MKRAADLKQVGESLGQIVALMEMINRYMASQKRGKTPKQNDRALLKLLKKEYELDEAQMEQVLSIVAGHKKDAKGSQTLSEDEKNQLKAQIDEAIAALGITIRESNLDEIDYLKKVKANLSVRKAKLMAQLDPSREKRRGRPRAS